MIVTVLRTTKEKVHLFFIFLSDSEFFSKTEEKTDRMDTFLIILGAILMVIGLLGCVLPVLPGPPLSLAALVIIELTEKVNFTPRFFIVWIIITILVTVIDYYIPIWGAKKFGGSKFGIWGSVIGMFVGFLFPPIGIIIGTFLGAVIGELIGQQNSNPLKAGLGTFIGFLGGIFLKLTASGVMLFYFIKAIA